MIQKESVSTTVVPDYLLPVVPFFHLQYIYMFQLEDIKSMMIPAVIAWQMPSCFQAWQSHRHVSWERVMLIQRPIQKLEVSSSVQPVRY